MVQFFPGERDICLIESTHFVSGDLLVSCPFSEIQYTRAAHTDVQHLSVS
jgi:hypothetical protein